MESLEESRDSIKGMTSLMYQGRRWIPIILQRKPQKLRLRLENQGAPEYF